MKFYKKKPLYKKTWKKKTLSKTDYKAVRRVCKAVLAKNTETKSFLSVDMAESPVDALWRARNLFFNISQGDDAENYNGKSIKVSHLTFRIVATLGNTTGLASRQGRIIIFSSKDTLGTSNSIALSTSSIARLPTPTNSTLIHLDMNKITIHKDFTFNIHPNVSNSTTAGRVNKHFNFKLNLNKVLKFTDNNSGLLKNKQYYIAFTGFDGTISQVPIDYGFQYSINYKDL